jgi:hypothetical protein
MLLRRAEPHHVFHAGTEKYIVDKGKVLDQKLSVRESASSRTPGKPRLEHLQELPKALPAFSSSLSWIFPARTKSRGEC